MKTYPKYYKIEFGLHQSCMAGRNGYGSGVRPNHWIPGRDYTFIGQVDFEDREILKPGDKCVAQLSCIVPEQDFNILESGQAWHICEGNKIMGYAKVINGKGI